jgi:hypothetical protein
MPFPFSKSKSVEELQQEKEKNDLEITVAQQRRVLSQLKEHGLTLKSFGGSIKQAVKWLQEH